MRLSQSCSVKYTSTRNAADNEVDRNDAQRRLVMLAGDRRGAWVRSGRRRRRSFHYQSRGDVEPDRFAGCGAIRSSSASWCWFSSSGRRVCSGGLEMHEPAAPVKLKAVIERLGIAMRASHELR